jgi:F-type H+-transporting ATPase subunit b
MVAVLNRTLFKPINKVLAEREQKTQGSLSETDSLIIRTNLRVQEYETQLRGARTDGYREMEQKKLDTLRERDQKIRGLKDEIANWTAEEKTKLNRQAETVRQQLEAESGKVGVEIASRILGRPTSDIAR